MPYKDYLLKNLLIKNPYIKNPYKEPIYKEPINEYLLKITPAVNLPLTMKYL